MTERLELPGRVALVTGGTRGVGRGIATRLAAAGADVVVCGRNPPADLPPGIRFVAADVRDVEQLDRVIAACPRLDLLVNNAGGSPFADAATASPRFSSSIIQLNLIAPLWLAQRANAVMQQQPEGGAIVNIASVSGVRASPGTAAYGAAKAGLIHLTKTLAIEWASKVRVNAIVAGPLKTELAHMHYGDEAGVEAVARTIPLGRLGTPEDVAEAVLFLASERSRWISGAALTMDGGGERPAFLGAVEASKK
jgi:NAD(P)-dependent dehydrogenase (short-subunit alcohol dehydrogenase family)